MEPELRGEQSKYRWVVLTVSLFAFVAYAFAFQSVPPLIQSIKTVFHVSSDAQVALAMSVVPIPGIFLSLPAGVFVRKYGVRRIGDLSLLGVVAGSLVSALADSFSTLLIGRLILGIGGTFVITATSFIVAQ
jgi:predicted MFS family arabinose efflux permease